ncbi:MAG: AI-2E family transporter [Hyphomicrobiaceae bacterium]|nr:AI-2E family transporter [Hyphomicrobiaceae bacterium]
MRPERQVVYWSLLLVAVALAAALLSHAILPFVLGVLLAYALNPLVRLVMRARLPRTLASAIVLVLGLALIGLAFAVLAPFVVDQLQKFAISLPGLATKLKVVAEDVARERLGSRYGEFQGQIDAALSGAFGNWSSIASNAANQLLAQMKSLWTIVSILLVTPLVAFYVLCDWEPMLAKIDGWLPREHAPMLRRLGADINNAISAFVRGQGTVCMILALYYAISLHVVGLNYGLLLGLVTGVLSFVPFVGWALGLIVSLTVGLAQYWPATQPLLMIALVFAVGYVLDAFVLSPKLVGERLGLHPVWLLFALAVFSSLMGFVGILIAVPVAAAIAVLVRYGLEFYLRSDLYKGDTTA